MAQVSATEIADARKAAANVQARIPQRLAFVTQERAAALMGESGSTVSRLVSDGHLARACSLLAALGLQLAPANAVVVEADELKTLKRMACKYLQADLSGGDA